MRKTTRFSALISLVTGALMIAAVHFGGAAGCGSSSGGGGGGGGGTIGTSSGRLTTPSGAPVAGASVVVSSSSGAGGLTLKNAAGHPLNISKQLTDDEGETCEDIDVAGEVRGSDCTDSDGNYTIDYTVAVDCGDTVTFTAKKEAFQLQLTLTVTCDSEGEDQDLDFDEWEFDDDCGLEDEVALVLNGGKFTVAAECESGEENIPNMAVCEGAYDTLQDVLAKLGYAGLDETTGQWDGADSTADFDFFASRTSDFIPNPEGNTRPSCCDLLQGETVTTANGDEVTIDNYDIIFLNCGNGCDEPVEGGGLTSGYLEDAVLDPLAQTAIQDWVEAGGRLYVTDLSYDFVEQNFPDLIDFGGDGADPAVAETTQVAQSGAGGITVAATVDEELRDFLEIIPDLSDGTPILNADDTVTIEGFLGSWAQMIAPHAGADVTVWVEGTVTGGVADPQPLTVTSEVGEGEVLYTSYHTEESSSVSDGLEPDEMRPQEWILGFLVFEL